MPIDISNLSPKAALQTVERAVNRGAVDTSDIGYDIVVGWGASNTVGYGVGIDTNLDFPNPRVLVMGSSGTYNNQIILAQEPLPHAEIRANNIGGLLTFGKELARTIPANRSVLIVASALGGSGFNDNRWNPGNDLYNGMVTRINSVLTSFPKSRVRVFYGMQHGLDATGQTTEQYITRFLAFIDALRALYGNVPFVFGRSPDSSMSLDGNARLTAFNAVVNSVAPIRQPFAAITGAGLAAEADNVHYTAASQRIMGQRMFEALSPYIV